MLDRQRGRLEMAERFVDAYRRYCWTVETLDDPKVAPFQILAGEGRVDTDRDHSWHVETIERVADASGSFVHPTRRLRVNVNDPASQDAGTTGGRSSRRPEVRGWW
jgi:protein phosphatase